MKSIQFQKYSKKLLPFVIVCGLILIFTCYLPITGTDLHFSAQLGEGGPTSWFAAAEKSGGNYLSAILGAMLVDVPVLRHILTAAMLSATIIALLYYSGAERTYSYFMILLLALLTGADVYAHTFGSTLGGAVILLPSFLTMLYLFTVSDLFVYKGKKKGWKIPFLFLSGFVCQFFAESVGIALLLLSLVFLFMLMRKHGFSFHLGAYSFGCLLGLTLSLLITGGEDRFISSFYVMVDQFTLALDQLFTENLILLGLLTLACLILIQPIRSERSKNCNITLFLLLVPMVLFLALNVVGRPLKSFPEVYRYLTVLKLVAAIGYCIGVLRTVQHYVSKDRVILRVQHCMIAVLVFVLVFSFCGTTLPNMLYIPGLCLVAVTALIYLYTFHRHSKLDKVLRKPLLILAIVGILLLSFVNIANGYYWNSVDTYVRESLNEGTTELILPEAPYETRTLSCTDTQLSEYYDFPSYGNVNISYIPFAQWDWYTYYEAHNVPVIEEYDEDAAETEDWTYEFEEDD